MQRQILRETLAQVSPREYVRKCDADRQPPWDSFRALADAGWLGLGIPEAYGGSGGTTLDIALYLEEVGRAHVDLALWMFRVMVYGGQAVLADGTDEQRNDFLPKVARGERHTCFSLTEPQSGSDAAALTTSAVADGDDYVINGQKIWCTGFLVSDYVLIAVRTNPNVSKHRGISLFLLDTKAPGITAQKLESLGHRSVSSTALFLDNVRTPKSSMLGELDQGWKGLGKYLEWERMCLSAARIGGAQAAFEDALAYAKTREQFGQPIGKFQAISHKLAEMAMAVDTARLLVYRYAWMIGEGMTGHKEAAMLKLFAAETYQKVADLGLQVMGSYGYSMENDMQRHFRDARLASIGGGTSEIQKNIIARELGL
jgi:alkylation response protein AidB-like acyl-CoA dehydrogenase